MRIIIGLACLLCVVNCSRGSTSSEVSLAAVTAGTFQNISDLPKITDPVVPNGSLYSKIRKILLPKQETQMTASQGTKLSDFGRLDWSEEGGLEPASCESANIYREMLNNAAESTGIQCHLSAMPNNIFDGQYHLFSMSDEDRDDDSRSDRERGPHQETPDGFKVKIKASKDVNGNITDFEVFACSGGQQEMYAKQSINNDGSTVIMAFNHHNNRGSESFSGQGNMMATGKINSHGQWISKHVEATMVESGQQYHDSDGSGHRIVATNSSGKLTLDESADHILISGGRTGTFGEESFTERFSTAAGIILPVDPNDIFGRQLIEGSAKHISARNDRGSEMRHWGIDLKPTETSPWASLVGEPPEIMIAPPGFTAEQAWDCTGEFEQMTMDPGTEMQHDQCDIQREHEFVNCWRREHYQPPEQPKQPEQPEQPAPEQPIPEPPPSEPLPSGEAPAV